MAQPARPYPTPDSKSPCQGLSESVVGFSGGAHFTRLDSGEQCDVLDVRQVRQHFSQSEGRILGVQSILQSKLNYGSNHMRLEEEFGSKVIKNKQSF